MIGLTTSAWWVIGYAIGGGVVLLARRIVSQTARITLALDGAERNTEPLFDLAMVNHSIESLTRGLTQASGETGEEDERTLVQRLTSMLGRRL